MLKGFRSNFGIKNKWKTHKNKSLLYLNIILGALAFGAGLIHYRSPVHEAPVPLSQEIRNVEAPPSPQSFVEKFAGQITKHMTLSDVLSAYNFPPELSHQLFVATKPIYNLSKLIVGKKFELERLSDGTLKQFLYEIDLDKSLRVYLPEEGYQAKLKLLPYETRTEFVKGAIQNSLFHTIHELRENHQLALNLAEIFSWDIDFNTDLQPADHFKLVVEKQYLEGKFIKYGKILAAEFTNKAKVYSAFYFADREGHSDYYNPEGKSLKRDFLKSPIKFFHLSSKFSYKRFHPILETYRPHLGVDYAAPAGTPVIAAGSGRIQFAGWKGGFGRFIEINHGNGLASRYGHLSRFASGIRTGFRVKQGQVIGYVGATGLASAPHLDYRVTRNGSFVNPLSIKLQPSAPVKSEYLAEFEAQRKKWQTQLGALSLSQNQQQASGVSPSHHAE